VLICTANWLAAGVDFFGAKSTYGWWLIIQMNMAVLEHNQCWLYANPKQMIIFVLGRILNQVKSICVE
jgi:hypothetical protein